MNSTSIVAYRPLLEVVDFHQKKYYTEMSRDQFEELMDKEERIYFSFSDRGVRVAQIVSWGPADPEDVLIAWETQKLNVSQKRCFEASKKMYLDFYGGTRPMKESELLNYVRLAKEYKVAKVGC